jgi:hypothetical protein
MSLSLSPPPSSSSSPRGADSPFSSIDRSPHQQEKSPRFSPTVSQLARVASCPNDDGSGVENSRVVDMKPQAIRRYGRGEKRQPLIEKVVCGAGRGEKQQSPGCFPAKSQRDVT